MGEQVLLLSLLVVIIFMLLVMFLVIVYNYVNKRKNNLKTLSQKNKSINNQNSYENQQNNNEEINKIIKENQVLKRELDIEIENYKILNMKLETKINEEIVHLEKIANVSKDDAKMLLLANVEKNLNKQKSQLIQEFNAANRKELEAKAANIILEVMERSAEDLVIQKTSFTFKLKDDNIKGRIIGKDGRNKKTFESVTGVDLIIEKDPEITISSLNPIRREVARQLLEKLLETKSVEPSRIEKLYLQIKENFDNTLYDVAADMLENQLNIFDVNKDFYKTIGNLNFRTSYGQNILQHSKECAMLASSIASELGLDPNKAKKAAFFHDIGKAIDFEIDNDHVESGLKLAREMNLEPYICNAIESHHDRVYCDNVYSTIVKIVDKISASRPGARFVSHEEYIKRVTTIENICSQFPGVKNAYAIKAGKQVRVIVNPSIVNDSESEALLFDIKTKLEADEIVNKQPIEIILIRENRFETKSLGSAERSISD